MLNNHNFYLENNKVTFTKKVCWDIEKRGAVGETPLHICLLNGSKLHLDLARRLVKLFPCLVQDIHLSDEYYGLFKISYILAGNISKIFIKGENALHIAIANQDLHMVSFLLKYKADIHGRCCGEFFCPTDQKYGRNDSVTDEYPIVPVETNYDGTSYYGEYPLSFAAVIEHYDCVRLLFANGVDPNKQDSNGNTVLHMLVIHNKLVINI